MSYLARPGRFHLRALRSVLLVVMSLAEERKIFNTLMNIVQRIPADAPIYHYGGYEPRVLGHIVKKYRLGYDSIKRRLVKWKLIRF